jgi:hypothetical protein
MRLRRRSRSATIATIEVDRSPPPEAPAEQPQQPPLRETFRTSSEMRSAAYKQLLPTR